MRKIKRNFYLVIGVIALLSSSIYIISERGYAASPPTTAQISPVNNATITTDASGATNVTFVAKAGDHDGIYGLLIQVQYRKIKDASGRAVSDKWHNFGTSATRDPTVPNSSTVYNTVPNGIKSNLVGNTGWSCIMDWGGRPAPSSCNVTWSDGTRTGKPAFRYHSVYSLPVRLSAGTYEWTAHSWDRDLLSTSWTSRWYFNIVVPPSPPPPPPPPTPTPAPTPDESSGDSEVAAAPDTTEDIVAPVEDKEPPSAPSNLTAGYSAEDSIIDLLWSPASDNNKVAGYEIERVEKDQTNWEKIDDSESEEYTDFNFEPQKTYFYRVRAYDQAKNYSEYSNVAEVTVGNFEPNISAKDGGKISDPDGKMTLEFGAGAVSEDIFVSIEKTDKADINFEKNTKQAGSAYEVRAKNAKGEEVTSFRSQVTFKFNYSKNDIKGSNPGTIKIATIKDGKPEYLRTNLDAKGKEAKTLSDHLSAYVLIAEKSSPLLTFLRVLLWIFIIIAIAFGGYFGWIYYQKQKYKKDHRDDYIYKH